MLYKKALRQGVFWSCSENRGGDVRIFSRMLCRGALGVHFQESFTNSGRLFSAFGVVSALERRNEGMVV